MSLFLINKINELNEKCFDFHWIENYSKIIAFYLIIVFKNFSFWATFGKLNGFCIREMS